MKRITGIAIAVAAFIGCSYVGAANATPCSSIAYATMTVQSVAISNGVKPNADILASQRDMVANLTDTCNAGVVLRNAGKSVKEVDDFVADINAKMTKNTPDDLASHAASSMALKLGYAYGE